MESIENLLMSGDTSLEEIVSEIGMDFSRLDDLFCQNTLDFSLGGFICYASQTGNQRKLSVQ